MKINLSYPKIDTSDKSKEDALKSALRLRTEMMYILNTKLKIRKSILDDLKNSHE